MKYILYAPYLILLSMDIFAQELPLNSDVFFDKVPQVLPEILLNKPTLDPVPIVRLSEANSLDDRLNVAIVNKDWGTLENLLKQYHDLPNIDQTLYEYGLGALYQHQGQYKKAITLYQNILKRRPNLYYTHFDLAMMLFANKQFKEAKAEFQIAEPHIIPTLQNLVKQIVKNMDKVQAWQPQVNFSYESSDNVNQASSLQKFTIGNNTFIRSGESLPQTAHGIQYDFGVKSEKNIGGNHYIYTNAEINGVGYWDKHEYSELSLHANLGYRYKDAKQNFGIIPVIEQNWLGNSRYNKDYGAALEYSRRLSNQWQFSSNFVHLQKSYQDNAIAKFYDGYSNNIETLLLYQPLPKSLFFAGLDFTRENLNDEAESSDRQGIRGGFVYMGDSLAVRTSLRYGTRKFRDNNFWYKTKRKDNEYELGTVLWKKQWQWKGFTPKINYQYQKVDSNLPLYERSDNKVLFVIDKNFQ